MSIAGNGNATEYLIRPIKNSVFTHLFLLICWLLAPRWHFALPFLVERTREKCVYEIVNQIFMNAFNSIDSGYAMADPHYCLSTVHWLLIYSDWNPKKESKWYSYFSSERNPHPHTHTHVRTHEFLINARPLSILPRTLKITSSSAKSSK